MRTIPEAIAWANAQTWWTKFSCLNFVDNAYYPGEQTPLGAAGIPLPTAKAAWNASQHKVTDGSLPPVGGLMYFDGVPGDEAGDVQIRTGQTTAWRTDVGTAGHCGSVPLMWMRDTVGHRYLGWTRDILGTVVFPTTTVASTGTTTLLETVRKADSMLPFLFHEVTTTGDQAYLAAGPKRLFQVNPTGDRAAIAKFVNAGGGQNGATLSPSGSNWPRFNEYDVELLNRYYASQK